MKNSLKSVLLKKNIICLHSVFSNLNEIWSGLELVPGLIFNDKLMGCLRQGIVKSYNLHHSFTNLIDLNQLYIIITCNIIILLLDRLLLSMLTLKDIGKPRKIF